MIPSYEVAAHVSAELRIAASEMAAQAYYASAQRVPARISAMLLWTDVNRLYAIAASMTSETIPD